MPRATPLQVANLARYLGADSATHEAIVRCLTAVPEAVREFAVDEVLFVSAGNACQAAARFGMIGPLVAPASPLWPATLGAERCFSRLSCSQTDYSTT